MFGFTKTSWETSWYGGVKRILTEYPFVTSSYDVYYDIEPSTKMATELSKYQEDKMINIMFYEFFKAPVNKRSFQEKMFNEYTTLITDKEAYDKALVKHSYLPQIKLKLVIPKDFVDYIVSEVCDNSELVPIFKEYGDGITHPESEIYILMDLPDNPPPGESPDEDGENPEESEGGESKGSIDSAIKRINAVCEAYRDKQNIENHSVTMQDVGFTRTKSKVESSEIRFANQLYNLLDLKQDPTSDTIKNLYQGRLDSEKLAEVLSGNNRVYERKVENETVKPFKVVILGDYSGSMEYHRRIEFQKSMLKSMYYLFHDLLKVDDLEIYGHSGGCSAVIYRHHSPEYPHFLETIGTEIPYQENYDGPVIQELHKRIRTKTDKSVLFISLSDGQPAGDGYGGTVAIGKMKQILEKAKRDNFITVGIGMQFMHSTDMYQYSVTVEDFKKFHPVAQIINRAVKENLISEA